MQVLSKEEMLSINGGSIIACAGCNLIRYLLNWYSKYLKRFKL